MTSGVYERTPGGMKVLLLLSRRQVRLLYRSPAIAAWYVVLPLLLITSTMPMMRVVAVDGPRQVVPGFTLLFSAFLATTLAGRIVRDQQSGVWRYLMMTPASPLTVAAAPALAVASLGFFQITIALLFGGIVYDVDLVVDTVGLYAFLALPIGAGLLLASLTDDPALQVNIVNPLAILSSVLGGAIIPLSVQPDWVQALAYLSPHYYALHAGLLGVGVLIGGGVLLSAIAVRRFSNVGQYL